MVWTITNLKDPEQYVRLNEDEMHEIVRDALLQIMNCKRFKILNIGKQGVTVKVNEKTGYMSYCLLFINSHVNCDVNCVK